MALLFCDGCDSYASSTDFTKKWSSIDSTSVWTYSATGGVTGGGALSCSADDTGIRKAIRTTASSRKDARIAFWYKSSSPPAAEDFFVRFGDVTSGHGIGSHIRTNGRIELSQFSSNTSTFATHLGASTTNICDNQWHFIEIYVLVGSGTTDGAWSIKIDGIEEAGASNTDTYQTGTCNRLDILSVFGSDTDNLFDDIIVWDDEAGDSFTGALGGTFVIETLRPDGNGDLSQFVGSDGNSTNNYLLVDEANPDSSDYVGSGTDGNADLYTFGALSDTPDSIKGVVVTGYCALDSAGSENFRFNAKGGSTTTNGADKNSASVAYATYQQFFINDPNTGSAWTGAGVNSAQFGIEKRA